LDVWRVKRVNGDRIGDSIALAALAGDPRIVDFDNGEQRQ